MLRKNEAFIARVLAGLPSFAPNLRSSRRSCYNSFAEALKEDNPHFDELRFKIAANMGDNGEALVSNKIDEG